jgi:hypothetical protein
MAEAMDLGRTLRSPLEGLMSEETARALLLQTMRKTGVIAKS